MNNTDETRSCKPPKREASFSTPMDIPPSEYPEIGYAELKSQVLLFIERDWGQRCETKDTDDFDDLATVENPDAVRCSCCLVYDKFDKFWDYFDHEARL